MNKGGKVCKMIDKSLSNHYNNFTEAIGDMKYHQLLKQYIENSGLSHREISRRCKEKGTPISQAYISQLAKGDVPPASDEVNRMLAVVTGGDPDALIIAGYREKAPERIREMLDRADNVVLLIHQYIDSLVKAMSDDKGRIEPAYRKLLIEALKESGVAVTEEDRFLHHGDEARALLRSLDIESKLQMLTILLDSCLGCDSERKSETLERRRDRASGTPSVLRVPVYRNMRVQMSVGRGRKRAAGFLDEEEEWEFLWNADGFREQDLFYLIVRDDAMAGSRIFGGDKALVCRSAGVQNGDIAAVALEDGEAVLRRVWRPDAKTVLICADNPRYEPLVLSSSRVFILGKVIRVTFDLRGSTS